MTRDEIRIGWRLGDRGRFVVVPEGEALRHTLVLGKSGSGKTLWMLALVCQLLARARRCVTLVDLKGESVELLLALLQILERSPPLRAEDVCVLAPGSGYGVPLNPLVRVRGIDEATQAAVVTQLLDEFGGGGFGPRMVNVARTLLRAVMAVGGGSLLDVRALLVDEALAPRLAPRIPDPELRHWLTTIFPREPLLSRESIRARLENLLAIPAVRSMLCAAGCVPGSRFLESPLTLVHLGIGGLGSARVARFVGSWIFTLLTAAVFGRDMKGDPPHATVVIDEWQELAKIVAEDIESLLAMARSNRVNLVLVNQYAGQIRAASPALWEGVATNVALEVLFRPSPEDLRHVEAALPVSGRVVDPRLPDRLLSEADERRALIHACGNLRPREALFVNHLAGERAALIATPEIPIRAARGAWDKLPAPAREAWLRGRDGVPLPELAPSQIALPAASADDEVAPEAGLPRAKVTRFPKGRGGRLVLA